MFNTKIFNSNVFNIWPHSVVDVSSILSYNWYSLKSDTVITSQISWIDDLPDINLATYNIAKSNGMGQNEYTLKKKVVTLVGNIIWTDVSDAEKILIAMKTKVIQHSGELKYVRNDWEILSTTASCSWFIVPREKRSLNVIPFQIEFTILDPFFYSTEVTEQSFVGQTADIVSSLAYEYWGYEVEPVVFITFNTSWWVTTIDFTLGGATLSINKAMSAGDVLKIDCKTKDILINDVWGQDYTGVFPKLSVWETPFTIDMNGTFNVDVYFQRRATYG